MATLYTQKDSNIRRTWGLFIMFFAVVLAIGWLLSYVYDDATILIFASLFSIVSAFVSYWSADKIALSISRAVPVTKEQAPDLWNIVENLSITAGLPMPRLYITPEAQINAFATGRNPQHAAVAVTQGALQRLSRTELEGVLAHELSHVGNRDILVSTVAVVLAGVISLVANVFLRSRMFGGFGSMGDRRGNDREGGAGGVLALVGILFLILAPIGATLLKLAISRRRESLADESGVLLTRYPEGLIGALRKIQADQMPMRAANDATAHMWIDNPFKANAAGAGEGGGPDGAARVSWLHRLFLTHPPIEERIRALEQS